MIRQISKNALYPIIVICVVTTPAFLTAAYLFRDDHLVSRLLLLAAFLPVLVGCIAYGAFAIWKPNELRSEVFLLSQQAMQLVAQKGANLEIAPVSLEAISNPAARQIEPAREEPHR